MKFKNLALLVCLPIFLTACATVFSAPAPSLDAPAEVAPQAARFILTFRTPTVPPWTETLANIQQQTGARKVQYAGPLGPSMHIVIIQPGQGQSLATLLERLKTVSYLLSAEMDSKARHH